MVGHVAVARCILQHDKLDVNTVDVKGRSAFYWDNYRGHLGVIQEL
jgi:hypothetical protein